MMKRLQPGQKVDGIHAATWNRFADTSTTVSQTNPPATNKNDSRGAAALRVLIQNKSDENIEAKFPVLKLEEPLYMPQKRASVIYEGVQFTGKKPNKSTPLTELVIVQGPIPKDQFRSAVVLGPTWAEVEFSDRSHKAARPTGDATKLVSATGGIKIIKHDPLPEDDDDLPATVEALIWLGRSGGNDIREGIFGQVTDPADPEGDGEYVGLNGDLLPVDDDGNVIEGSLAGYGKPFTNIQQNCGCPEGARIVVTMMKNSDGEDVTYGYCVDAMDQLSTLGGDNPGGLLGGSGVKHAEWSKADCSTP